MEINKAYILIVDDEPINIQVLKLALKSDYDIETAAGGEEAIAKIKERAPDLILLDVMMPGLNGFDVCKVIKGDELTAHIPIIFLTALDTVDGEIKGLKAGGIDYLTKPFNIDLVRLRIGNHISLKWCNDLLKEQRDLLVRQKFELEEALSRVKQLEGIIPICMYCKKIRDDQNDWNQLEQYISDHSEAVFSHGICPVCSEKQMEILNNMK
jgi:DNA-binding response OmpR family regulator